MTEREKRERDLLDRRNQVKIRQELNIRAEARNQAMINSREDAAGDAAMLEEAKRMKETMAVKNNAQLEEEQTRITTFEEAFKKIKEATGVSDVNEVIQKFMTQEDTHNNLKQITKESQVRIDQLNAERTAILARLEELKYAGSGLEGSRRMVDEYEGKLGETAATCDKQRVKYEKVAKTLIQ